jgi:probable phosphomutase (TIGR03848 family)
VTVLLLVRHALTEATGKRLSGRTPGIHLSEEGREQARALAGRLDGIPVRGIYASPLERCMETATAIATTGRLTPVPVPGLMEVGYGGWTGRPLAQLARTALWKRVQQSPSSVRFPDGETLAEAQHRAVEAVERVAEQHPKDVVVAVSHADVIRLMLAHFAGVHLDLFQRLIVSPASVSAVLLGDRVPRILRLNDSGGLGDLIPTRPRPSRRRP